MASAKRKLNVVHSPTAVAELQDIWAWNAERYSAAHADAYLEFLGGCMEALSLQYAQGRPISGRPDWQYVAMRRKAKGHCHIAVYRVTTSAVDVLHVVHSAQEWQGKLFGLDH